MRSGDRRRRRRAAFPAPVRPPSRYRAAAPASRARVAAAGPRIPSARECARPARRRGGGARSPRDAAASCRVRRPCAAAIMPVEVEAEHRADQHPRVEFGVNSSSRSAFEACARQIARPCRPAMRSLSGERLRPTPACSRRRALGGELRGLMLGGQRVDQFAQRFAGDHLRQLVERQVDAVIGDAALREIVGADALGAVAGADLLACGRPSAPRRCAAVRRRRCASAGCSSPRRGSCAASGCPASSPRCRSECG